MVVLLRGEWSDDPGLVQEIAVDLGPVEGPLTNLHLDEVALEKSTSTIYCLVRKLYLTAIKFLNFRQRKKY